MIHEAQYLLDFDFKNGISDLNRLYAAVLTNEIPDKIMRVSVNKMSHHHKSLTPLHCACINPNPAILKNLLKLCPVFSLPDQNRRNLVHYAAANTNPEVLSFLLQNGSEPNELDA